MLIYSPSGTQIICIRGLSDTLLAYKQRNKLGRFAEDKSASSEPAPSSTHLLDIKVGERCEVEPGDEGGLHKRGVVRFVGPTEFGNKLGVWIGIQYDEPVGKNDGSSVNLLQKTWNY